LGNIIILFARPFSNTRVHLYEKYIVYTGSGNRKKKEKKEKEMKRGARFRIDLNGVIISIGIFDEDDLAN